MLNSFIATREAGYRVVRRVVRDQNGVVSFEYVIVAACIVGAVALAFTNGSTGIGAVLSSALTAIGTKVTAALALT